MHSAAVCITRDGILVCCYFVQRLSARCRFSRSVSVRQKEAKLREQFAAAQAAAAAEGTPADLQRHVTLVEEREHQLRKAVEAREEHEKGKWHAGLDVVLEANPS